VSPTEEWYPADAEAVITLEIRQERPAGRIDESPSPMHLAGRRAFTARFHEDDSNPGPLLTPEVVAALLADSRGPLRDGQRIEPDRLNIAAERAAEK
jgi:hypothetical protein